MTNSVHLDGSIIKIKGHTRHWLAVVGYKLQAEISGPSIWPLGVWVKGQNILKWSMFCWKLIKSSQLSKDDPWHLEAKGTLDSVIYRL